MTSNELLSVRFRPRAVVARFLCAILLFAVAHFLPATEPLSPQIPPAVAPSTGYFTHPVPAPASIATLQLVHSADYIAAAQRDIEASRTSLSTGGAAATIAEIEARGRAIQRQDSPAAVHE